MAVEYMNDSYNRCIAELRTRYRGRAVSSSAKDEVAVLDNKTVATESYILFDSRSKIADSYRSGEYNGSKYMTSEDFVRYFRSRRAFYMPSAQKAQEAKAEEAEASSVPQRKNGASPASPSESGSKESHTGKLLSAAKRFAIKWFPIERREGRSEGARAKFPVPVLAGIAVFAISMSLIVGSSVMVGDSTAIVGKLDSEIAALEAQKDDLQGKLDLKYTVEEIESDAKALGMIKREYADSEYLTIDNDDEIKIYDDGEEENISLASLLSAFGIEPRD